MLKVEQTSHNTNKSFILHFTNLYFTVVATVVHCVNTYVTKVVCVSCRCTYKSRKVACSVHN